MWSLKDIRHKVMGESVCIHKDSHSVFNRPNNAHIQEIKEDARVMRLLTWLWEIFPILISGFVSQEHMGRHISEYHLG